MRLNILMTDELTNKETHNSFWRNPNKIMTKSFNERFLGGSRRHTLELLDHKSTALYRHETIPCYSWLTTVVSRVYCMETLIISELLQRRMTEIEEKGLLIIVFAWREVRNLHDYHIHKVCHKNISILAKHKQWVIVSLLRNDFQWL